MATLPASLPDSAANPDAPLKHDETGDLEFKRLEELNRDWDDHFNEEHRGSRASLEEEGDRKLEAMANMPDRPPSLITAEETLSLRRQGGALACRECGAPLMAPRTVWLCQPVAATIWPNVAPSGRRSGRRGRPSALPW